MMAFVDETTRQRVVSQKHTGDIVYPAKTENGDTVLERESKVVTGPWKDFTGSGGPANSRNQLMWAGTTNTLAGEDADLNGAKLPNLNEIGQNTETHRRRQKLIYVEDVGTKRSI